MEEIENDVQDLSALYNVLKNNYALKEKFDQYYKNVYNKEILTRSIGFQARSKLNKLTDTENIELEEICRNKMSLLIYKDLRILQALVGFLEKSPDGWKQLKDGFV